MRSVVRGSCCKNLFCVAGNPGAPQPTYAWTRPRAAAETTPKNLRLSILPQILPQTSSQTKGNSRVSQGRETQEKTDGAPKPFGFLGHFRKRKDQRAKCWGATLSFPFCLPEKYVLAKLLPIRPKLELRSAKIRSPAPTRTWSTFGVQLAASHPGPGS